MQLPREGQLQRVGGSAPRHRAVQEVGGEQGWRVRLAQRKLGGRGLFLQRWLEGRQVGQHPRAAAAALLLVLLLMGRGRRPSRLCA